jgi:hypothetical protein
MSELLYPPRGMSRVAAAYVGVSPTLFDAMVGDGRMPGPKLINTRTVWDPFALDRAWAEVERFCRRADQRTGRSAEQPPDDYPNMPEL